MDLVEHYSIAVNQCNENKLCSINRKVEKRLPMKMFELKSPENVLKCIFKPNYCNEGMIFLKNNTTLSEDEEVIPPIASQFVLLNETN